MKKVCVEYVKVQDTPRCAINSQSLNFDSYARHIRVRWHADKLQNEPSSWR